MRKIDSSIGNKNTNCKNKKYAHSLKSYDFTAGFEFHILVFSYLPDTFAVHTFHSYMCVCFRIRKRKGN